MLMFCSFVFFLLRLCLCQCSVPCFSLLCSLFLLTLKTQKKECLNPPYDALSHNDGLGVVNEIVKVLEHEVKGEEGVRMLFFNGITDLICNHVGNEILLERLPWKHRDDWTKATRSAWKSKAQQGDNISGYIKEYNNLLFLKVMESGHMVPMDVPDVALGDEIVPLWG